MQILYTTKKVKNFAQGRNDGLVPFSEYRTSLCIDTLFDGQTSPLAMKSLTQQRWRVLVSLMFSGLPLIPDCDAFQPFSTQFWTQTSPRKYTFRESTLTQQHNPLDCQSKEYPTSYSPQTPKCDVSVLLIDHYDSFTYNLYDYLSQLLVKPPCVITKDAYTDWNPKTWEHIDGIVLSPGPGTPQAQPPLSHLAVSKNPNVPILGVCLGHQLMALSYGATVEKAPVPIHGQVDWISQQSSMSSKNFNHPSLFHDIPESFQVVRYHSLAAYNIPACLEVTARSSRDQVVQAIQHQRNPHYGLQFHPESIGTQHGLALMANFCHIVECHKQSKILRHTAENVLSVPGTKLGAKISDSKVLSSSSPPVSSRPSSDMKPKFRVVLHPFLANAKPLQVFEKLYANQTHCIWLDSSSSPSRGDLDIMAAPLHRSDILDYKQEHQLSSGDDILTILERGLFGAQPTKRPTSSDIAVVENPTDSTQQLTFRKDDFNSSAEHPIPFQYRGGYLGYLSYEVRRDTDPTQPKRKVPVAASQTPSVKDGSNTPSAAFFLARRSLVFHHPTKTWYAVGLLEEEERPDTLLEWMQDVKESIISIPSLSASVLTNRFTKRTTSPPAFTLRRSVEKYKSDIAKCHELIRQGESYELCLTNQLETDLAVSRSTWDLYKELRKRNPAPYSAYFQWKTDNSPPWAICCSSPERFMSVQWKQGNNNHSFLQAEAKPIKGTEARVLPKTGQTLSEEEQQEDERRARNLEQSLKNRAENLMIVDLLRNDLSRVCKVGSVHVANLMAIESFATVHQMVSTIRGALKNDQTSIDLLRASFPGGSMTGAPKIRTMELLEELEEFHERGPYSGCLGYLSVNGCMDMNIIIRSAVVTPTAGGGQHIQIGAGGAITALSDIEEEYHEMMLKTRAVREAVQEWTSFETIPNTDAP